MTGPAAAGLAEVQLLTASSVAPANLAQWSPVLPRSDQLPWLLPLLMAVISGGGALAGWLATRRRWRTGYTRKAFHALVFGTATILHLAVGLGAVHLLGALMAGYILTLVRVGRGNIFYEGIARPGDAPHRSAYVLIPFLATAVGGILSTAWFGAHAAVGFAVTGLGDALGEPVGVRWGRHRFRAPSLGKVRESWRSVEGSVAVFLGSFVACGLVLALGDFATRGLGQVALISLAVAAAGTTTEAISHRGVDNLTMQLAASGVAAWLCA